MIACASCQNTQDNSKDPGLSARDSLYQRDRLAKYNQTVYPGALKLVQPGDIVTRCGIDLTSEMLRRLNEKDPAFSHIGIASMENDTAFVYHAIGGEFNPDQKLKRETLWSFLHSEDNKKAGVFRLPLLAKQRDELIAEVKALYSRQIPFDMDFDWVTNDRLYCAEFVVKSLCRVLDDSNYFHHTFVMGKEGVAIDDVTQNTNCTCLGKWNY